MIFAFIGTSSIGYIEYIKTQKILIKPNLEQKPSTLTEPHPLPLTTTTQDESYHNEFKLQDGINYQNDVKHVSLEFKTIKPSNTQSNHTSTENDETYKTYLN